MKFPSLPLLSFLYAGDRLKAELHDPLQPSWFYDSLYTQDMFLTWPAQLFPLLAKLFFCLFNHLKSFLSFILQCTWSRQAARGHSKEVVWRFHRLLWPWEEITHMAILSGISDKCCNCWTLAKGNEGNGFAGITSKVCCFFTKHNKNVFQKQQKSLQGEENTSKLCLVGENLASLSNTMRFRRET